MALMSDLVGGDGWCVMGDVFAGRITQLMEQLDVYISVKPKPKQPSKVSCTLFCFVGFSLL